MFGVDAFEPSGGVDGVVGLAAEFAGPGGCAGVSVEEVGGVDARWQAAKQSTISPTLRLARIIRSGRICVIAGQLYLMEHESIAPSFGMGKAGTIGCV
ncbi:MAG: hypothetical protein C4336_06645 [Armatimonadota bacterium]